MSNIKDFDDDEYVAKLLAEDARKSSIKYASQGMSALLPAKSTASGLKPNTRFLKTLVREADSHNAALKKREEVEARARLRAIRDDPRSEGDRTRKHHDKDEHHGHHREKPREPDRKKRRLSYSDDEDKRARRPRAHRSQKTRRSRSPDGELSRTRERRYRTRRDDERSEPQRRSRQRRRSDDHKSLRLSRSRSRSIDRLHNRKDDTPESSRTHRHRRRSSHSSTTSDPLKSIVGPSPRDQSTTTKRGRGFIRGGQSSNIDAHFVSNYNPSLDVGADPESDTEAADWDNALEALRDRRAWREKQAERLREAGFDDDEIDRWEKSASSNPRLDADGDLRDVTWSKKGEQREWDVGKPAFGETDDAGDDVDDTLLKATERRERSQGKRKGGKVVGEAWYGKDSGLLKQFRSALG
ncbi:hypothetical protein PV08_05500 [Exophiala spinifera]|uniref:Pre-mRNA-splicing factor 38B n=1 Tax=Exophiala spinifera TaxID=91928 RepID=A0A0D2BW25_9EURO|nr:uncharacterized protein PV08_05500 [Exophiala spinifera]KIW15454.1 hypothetical protein PV08_05500 [Exophiala spinifera]